MEIDNKLYLRCHKLQGSFICCKQNYRLWLCLRKIPSLTIEKAAHQVVYITVIQ